jgi:malonyl-CoA O-methyltransferase
MNTSSAINPQRIRAEFQRVKGHSDHYITVSKTLGEDLVQRLAALNLQPQVIVDLGAGRGIFTETLVQLYPQAKVIAVDYALSQLQQLDKAKESALCARAELLPFADVSIDVIFCHMMLQWCSAPEMVIQEIQRVLKPNGVLLFSVLAPDSLTELRQVFSTLSEKPYIPPFTDMHNWGDLLQKVQFKDPVVDVEYFSLYYKNFSQLMSVLRLGPTYFLQNMNKGLITPRQWQRLEAAYENYRDEYGLILTLEVVYGIAFGRELQLDDGYPLEASIPLQKVQRKR